MSEPEQAEEVPDSIQDAAHMAQESEVERSRSKKPEGRIASRVHPKWWREGFIRESLEASGFGTRRVKAFLASIRRGEVEGWRYGGGHRSVPGSARDSAYWHTDFEKDVLKVRPTSLIEHEAHVQTLARPLRRPSGVQAGEGVEGHRLALAQRIESVVGARLTYDSSGRAGEASLSPLRAFHILVREVAESIARGDPMFDGLPEKLVFHEYHGGESRATAVSDEEIIGWLWEIVGWLQGIRTGRRLPTKGGHPTR